MARSLTTRSTNPKIMDDNIKILDDALAVASTPPAEDVSYDNTDSGLLATNTQAALDELRANVVNVNARLISANVTYNSETALFNLPSNVTLYPQSQFSCVARNTNTGDLYMLTYYGQSNAFGVSHIISGNAPTNGNVCVVQYIGIYA